MTALFHSFDYDSSYSPPAPVVEVVLRTPETDIKTEPIIALIDSGADYCIFPENILKNLGAKIGWQAKMRGVTNAPSIPVNVYYIDIVIGDIDQTHVEVIGGDDGCEPILGRNFLNDFSITLNGLANTTEFRS